MGCPLRCAYCLNPYSWDQSVEPKSYTVDELYNEVKRDNIYFLSTGGGLVFGGGEPLLHSAFLSELIPMINAPVMLETNGTLPDRLERVIDLIDIISMDIKLPQMTGADHWADHAPL